SVRSRIEAGWGARAFDHAGMTEMGAYGYECEAQCGLHVNESEFVAEVIDPSTCSPADEGELVVTNLGRVGSTLIRYRTGDRRRRRRATRAGRAAHRNRYPPGRCPRRPRQPAALRAQSAPCRATLGHAPRS